MLTTAPPSFRVPLEAGHADVDVIDAAVEFSVRIGNRAALGLALTAAEAERLADALHVASRAAWAAQAGEVDLSGVRTVQDLSRVSAACGIPASVLIGQVQR